MGQADPTIGHSLQQECAGAGRLDDVGAALAYTWTRVRACKLAWQICSSNAPKLRAVLTVSPKKNPGALCFGSAVLEFYRRRGLLHMKAWTKVGRWKNCCPCMPAVVQKHRRWNKLTGPGYLVSANGLPGEEAGWEAQDIKHGTLRWDLHACMCIKVRRVCSWNIAPSGRTWKRRTRQSRDPEVQRLKNMVTVVRVYADKRKGTQLLQYPRTVNWM